MSESREGFNLLHMTVTAVVCSILSGGAVYIRNALDANWTTQRNLNDMKGALKDIENITKRVNRSME